MTSNEIKPSVHESVIDRDLITDDVELFSGGDEHTMQGSYLDSAVGGEYADDMVVETYGKYL